MYSLKLKPKNKPYYLSLGAAPYLILGIQKGKWGGLSLNDQLEASAFKKLR